MATNRLPLRKAYEFCRSRNLSDEVNAIENLDVDDFSLQKSGTVRRAMMTQLMERKGILKEFQENFWPFADSSTYLKKIDFYRSVKDEFENFIAGVLPDKIDQNDSSQTIHFSNDEESLENVEDEASGDDVTPAEEFALESHLRDFLAKNLEKIEKGLKLYVSPSRSGIEYPIERGRIDILAVDSRGKFVVIELKLRRGRSKTIGQLLYYMGWIDENLKNAPCRGIILASHITDDLIVATKRIDGVTLFKYDMNVSVHQVNIGDL